MKGANIDFEKILREQAQVELRFENRKEGLDFGGFTLKEIAGEIGKSERSVQRWAKVLGVKMSSIADKMAVSSPTRPARFSEEETLALVEHGLGKNAAKIFRIAKSKLVNGLVGNDRVTPMTNVQGDTERTYKLLMAMSSRMDEMSKRLDALTPVLFQKQEPLALPAPDQKPESFIRECIKDYARAKYPEYIIGEAMTRAWHDYDVRLLSRGGINLKIRKHHALEKGAGKNYSRISAFQELSQEQQLICEKIAMCMAGEAKVLRGEVAR